MTGRKKYFLIVYFCLLANMSLTFCQLTRIDSFKLELKNLSFTKKGLDHDTVKLNLFIYLSEECEASEIFNYAKPGIELADNLLLNRSLSKSRILNQKARLLNDIGFAYDKHGDFLNALDFYFKSLKIQRETGDKEGMAYSLSNIGGVYNNKGNISGALNYFKESLKIQEQIGDQSGIAGTQLNLGAICDKQGDIPGALNYYDKGLKRFEAIGDKWGMAYSLNNIGFIYYGQGDLTMALQYYNRSLAIQRSIGEKKGVAASFVNIGQVYESRRNITKALEYFNMGLKLHEEIADKSGMASSLNNIGDVYFLKNNFALALDYNTRSLKLYEEIGEKKGKAASLISIATVYFKQAYFKTAPGDKPKNAELAREFSNRSLELAKELGFPENILTCEKLISQIDSARGNYSGAFEHYKQFIFYRDSIASERNRKASIRNQLKYEYEKKEAVINEHRKKEQAIAGEKNRRQQIFIWSVAAGLLLVIGFAAFVFRSLKVTRRQKIIIEEKQKDILDSIRYAKRIQQSLLPNEKYIAKNLNRLFKN